MATTHESYRLQGRNPRYTTRLNSFANGMYLTNQTIPEGYAKVLINYDIDDTGSHIKPKRGRRKIQDVEYESTGLAGASLSDYLYCYDEAKENVVTTEDVVLSFGRFLKAVDYNADKTAVMPMLYAAKARTITDLNTYDANNNRVNDPAISDVVQDYTEFWALRYNNSTEVFEKVLNLNIESIAAHAINHAYAFDKAFIDTVGRPIYTVLENEIYTFTGTTPEIHIYQNKHDRDSAAFNEPGTLSKLILSKKDESDDYSLEASPIVGKRINPAEAYISGFNLLLASDGLMYKFENTQAGAPSILGAIPYTNNSDYVPMFYPTIGNTVSLGIWYSYTNLSTDLGIKLEIRNGDAGYSSETGWETVSDWATFTPSETEAHFITFAPKYTNTQYRVHIRNGSDSTTESTTVRPLYTFGSDIPTIDPTIVPEIKTCKGMITWQGCLGLYAFDNAKNMLIFSAVEEPDYFPFPGNVMLFDNEILAVHNYLNHLIVITVDSVYLISQGSNIATSTQKRILANINIPEIDATNLVVLKDQIFFKTDNQFYVLKPNQYTADQTNLKNYINSVAIANYLNNFTEETVNLLNKDFIIVTQKYTQEYKQNIKFLDFDVLDTWSVVKDSEVHYIYNIIPKLGYKVIYNYTQEDVDLVAQIINNTVEPTIDYLTLYDIDRDGEITQSDYDVIYQMSIHNTDYIYNVMVKDDEKLNLHLVYNTITRAWRMYFVAVGTEETDYKPVLYRNKQSGLYYEFFPHTLNNDDTISIVEQTYNIVDDNVIDLDNWNLVTDYNNYPYIETGVISVDDIFTKRFREVQLNLINLEKTKIRFYTNFVLDGQDRVDATKYLVEHITDINDPDFGRVWVTPVETDNLELNGLDTLANYETETDYWELDLSHFPDLSVVSVRLTLQGRGRRGNLQLLNTNLKRYELSDVNWVYRIMNAR